MRTGAAEQTAAKGRPTITAVTTAVPEHTVVLEQVKSYANKLFDLPPRQLDAIHSVIDNAQVRKRHLIFPLDYVVQPRPLSQISREYQQHAVCLGREVTRTVLAAAAIEPGDVELLITVSCTGVMIPSLDAHLINDLGFDPGVRRLPITELGCAAGTAALARAADFIHAYPDATVLVVAVELPSLTFQRNDSSTAHLISCVLFGDGAAATLVTGRSAAGARILDSASRLFPHSLDAMGFDLRDSGFHIILSPGVPELIRGNIREVVSQLLQRHGLTTGQLSYFLLHPGGQKVLAYIEQELGLSRQDTAASRDVLEQYGNLSSASVLFVLREFLNHRTPAAGERGLLGAFGPGFSSEMLLLEWN